MKKLLIFFILFAGLKTTAQELQIDCRVSGNSTILGYEEAKKYVANYDTLNQRSKENHTKAYYLNNSAILFLDSFFTRNTSYFGFNLYFVTYEATSVRSQRLQSQSLLYIAPAKLRTANDTITNFKILNTFYNSLRGFERIKLNNGIACYGSCDSSLMHWLGIPRDEYYRLNEVAGTVAGSDIFLLSTSSSTQAANRALFGSGQGKELNEQQTKSIFFNKNTIHKLAKFIKEGSNKTLFPMIGIYFGSYGKIVTGTYQKNEMQTMVGFVPMRRMVSGFYEPDICSYVNYWNTKAKMEMMEKDKENLTENHGQLCPNGCPDDNN